MHRRSWVVGVGSVLAGAGIVGVEPRARRRIYHLQAEPFDRIGHWLDSFERLWEARLDSGTRWPMEGTFTRIEEQRRLTYDARSWTEGEEETGTIHHTNDLTLTEDGGETSLTLHVAINEIGPGLKAKLAVFGMRWGYKSQLDALARHLAG